MKPICAKCEVFFRPDENGTSFIEGFGDGRRKPYKLWLGDRWKCPLCEAVIIVGTGERPPAVPHEEDFDRLRKHLEPKYFIDDC